MKDYKIKSINKMNDIIYVFELPLFDKFKNNKLPFILSKIFTSYQKGSLNYILRKKFN